MGHVFYHSFFFSEKFNIEVIYCTVGDHRSSGLKERLLYTVKSNFLAPELKKLIRTNKLSNNIPSDVPGLKNISTALLIQGEKNLISVDNRLDQENFDLVGPSGEKLGAP